MHGQLKVSFTKKRSIIILRCFGSVPNSTRYGHAKLQGQHALLSAQRIHQANAHRFSCVLHCPIQSFFAIHQLTCMSYKSVILVFSLQKPYNGLTTSISIYRENTIHHKYRESEILHG